jgi:hypothetical protein
VRNRILGPSSRPYSPKLVVVQNSRKFITSEFYGGMVGLVLLAGSIAFPLVMDP